MAVPGTGSTNQTLTFIAAKKVSGKAQTSNLKEIYNETIPSTVQKHTSTIFAEVIPQQVDTTTLYTRVSGTVEYVEFYVRSIGGTTYDANTASFGDVGFGGGDEAQSAGPHGYQLYLTASYQVSSSNPKKGSGVFVNDQLVNTTNGALQLVNPSFGPQTGNNYGLTIYTKHPASGGLQIPTTSPIEWTPDYYNGTIFVQDYLSTAVPTYARGWIYIGDFADDLIASSSGTPGGSTTQVQFNNAGAFAGSSNLTFNGTTLTGSYTGSLAEITTISASLMNLLPTSGTLAGGGSYLGLDANNNVILSPGDGATTSPGGSNTQIQFNNSGVFGASANLTFSSNVLNVSGGVVHRRTTAATSFTASADNYIIAVTSVPTSILLDATSFSDGQVLLIKDESGNASSTNSVTLDASASQTIDGQSNILIESPFGALHLYSNGTNWFIY